MTPLQTHVAFFDIDGDTRVTPEEFAKGLKELGMPGSEKTLLKITKPILAKQAQLVNDRLSALNAPATIERAKPESIPLSSIGFGKHDSDTDSYVDDTGAFDQRKFDAMFAKADRNGSGALDLSEILHAAVARRESVSGLAASTGEFVLLWALGSDVRERRFSGLLPKRKALSPERLAKTLQGQGFYEIANSVAEKKQR
jgi:Caleosin related protein